MSIDASDQSERLDGCSVKYFDINLPEIDVKVNPNIALETVETRRSDLFETVNFWLFNLASVLTDPICKAHELFRRISVVDITHKDSSAFLNLARKVMLSVAMIGFGGLSLVTTLPGIALRALAIRLQKQNYTKLPTKEVSGKTLPEDKSFTLLSWNICCVSGGYAISDGGVTPWASRIDRVIDKIIKTDADVNCLYELFDFSAAKRVAKKLQKAGYPYVYFNIDPNKIGVSSGILVASRYEVQSEKFNRFPEESLVQRTKFAHKGVFGFDLVSEGKRFARIFTTHLQHSERPEHPEKEEILGRKAQMEFVTKKAMDSRPVCKIVTGDLNLDDAEYQNSSWRGHYNRGDREFNSKSWGGDEFCAKLVGKPISKGLNLDHTLVLNRTAEKLHSTLVDAEFSSNRYLKKALSDHQGVFSKIYLKTLN